VRKLLRCEGCHSANLAGGNSFNGRLADGGIFPDGGTPKYYAANLTPADAGLGQYTIAQIKTALKVGRDRQNVPLAPVMPYPVYSTLTDKDAESIALYLKSLPANSKVIPKNTAATPTAPAPALVTTSIPQTGLPPSNANHAAAVHGRYLSILACLDCHTPRNAQNQRILNRAFAGGLGFGTHLKSANITPYKDGGIGNYTVTTFRNVLKTGMSGGQPLCPTMPSGPSGYGQLTDADINSMGHYLLSIPAIDGGPYGSKNPDGGC
jgi:mono/diheme cytochrome c family protein